MYTHQKVQCAMKINHRRFCWGCAWIILGMTLSWAVDLPNRTEITTALSDFRDVDPPVIDGYTDDPVWQYPPQGRVPDAAGRWLESPDLKVIGFDLAINEDDSEPVEEKDSGFQITWSGTAHDEASYGDLALGGPQTSVHSWELF